MKIQAEEQEAERQRVLAEELAERERKAEVERLRIEKENKT